MEESNSAIFRYFLLIFGLFFVGPLPGKFSADALACNTQITQFVT